MKKKIIIIILILLLLFLCGVLCLYCLNDNKIDILGYHGILPHELNTSGDDLIVDQEKFEKELKYLKKMNYHTMTLDEFYCYKQGECKKKHNSVLITFDDGYLNNYQYAFELLKEYDMNAVVFCVGSFINGGGNYMDRDIIAKLEDEYPNIEIASHTFKLHYHDDFTYDVVDNDIKLMKEIVSSDYFAYPNGDYNEDYIKALKDNGYKLAFTFGPGKEHRKASFNDDNYKIPRLNISNDMPMWKFILRLILPI